MSIPVVITLGNPDPDVAPLTFSAAINEIRTLLSAEIQETLSAFVIGAQVPAVDDQGKPWIRLDNFGSPLGTYIFFEGIWVRERPDVSARFGFFSGDPVIYFDGNGRGLKGAGPVAMDYWGWHLMNGQGGTPNLSNKFIILGQMDNDAITGFANGWRTNINGTPEVEGGQAEVFLDEFNTYRPPTDVLTVGTWQATGGQARGAGSSFPLYGIPPSSGSLNTSDLIPANAGNVEPLSVNIVNPFYCLAMVQFTGYGVI